MVHLAVINGFADVVNKITFIARRMTSCETNSMWRFIYFQELFLTKCDQNLES